VKTGCARAINRFSSSLLLYLITQHVSLCLSSYSRAFTVNDGELLLCFGVRLEHTALPTLRCLTLLPVLERASQDVLGELKTLANIIHSSVDKIEEVLGANAFVLPSSNAPFSLASEAPRMHPSIQSAGSLITSAAAQLMTLVRPAPLVVTDVVMQVNRIVPATIAHLTNNTSSTFLLQCVLQ